MSESIVYLKPTVLPFVRDVGERRDFWAVKATGDYEADCATGRGFAEAAIGYIRETGSVGLLGAISTCQAREVEKSGITVGFWSAIGAAVS